MYKTYHIWNASRAANMDALSTLQQVVPGSVPGRHGTRSIAWCKECLVLETVRCANIVLF